ncbi:barstar family protein [Cognataquiflexum aquatile]|uniref:barstar family protein n=1 Tax=Cognataquiflexum aquatile TaxID=2249427 RepID=UPI000DEA115B|nr:barstar family protein [Cognataquiflexum aquatile]
MKDHSLDFQILRDGGISMYHKIEILEVDLEWFENEKYKIYDMNACKWSVLKAHKEIKEKLNFPDYYGENLNAFNDCLRDMYSISKKGLVIVFRKFDFLAETDRDFATGLLDIISIQSREWLLKGKRLICLIQSTDPDLYFEKIGGVSPRWNGQECFDSKRRGS